MSIDFWKETVCIHSSSFHFLRLTFLRLFDGTFSRWMIVNERSIHRFILCIERSHINQTWLKFLNLFSLCLFSLGNFFWRKLWSSSAFCFINSSCWVLFTDVFDNSFSRNHIDWVTEHRNSKEKKNGWDLFHF